MTMTRTSAGLACLVFLLTIAFLYARKDVKMATILKQDDSSYVVHVRGEFLGTAALVLFIVVSSALTALYLATTTSFTPASPPSTPLEVV